VRISDKDSIALLVSMLKRGARTTAEIVMFASSISIITACSLENALEVETFAAFGPQ
jgi:hypothetical protein